MKVKDPNNLRSIRKARRSPRAFLHEAAVPFSLEPRRRIQPGSSFCAQGSCSRVDGNAAPPTLRRGVRENAFVDLLCLVVLLLTGFTACAGWPLRTTERSTRNFPLKRHVLLQVVQIQFPLLHRGDIPGTGTGSPFWCRPSSSRQTGQGFRSTYKLGWIWGHGAGASAGAV